MRVVIMGAGDGHRWKNYLGVPKQLTPVNGVPLLHRTLMLLRSANIEDVYVTVRERGMFGDVQGAKEYLPTDGEFEIDRIWGARQLVDGPTLFIYGDAYYTEKAIATMVTSGEGFHFFGRSRPSPCKPFGKIFGIRIDDVALSNAKKARELYRDGSLCRCIGWELYGLCVGTPLLGSGKKFFFSESDDTSINFTEIIDRTEDFNEPFEFERWLEHWTNVDQTNPDSLRLRS